MAHVYLKENDIILVGIQDGLEEWVSRGHINAFGVENIIQNGNPNFGRRIEMLEITMCRGRDCRGKERCDRFTSKPDKYRHSWFLQEPGIDITTCEEFVPNEEMMKKECNFSKGIVRRDWIRSWFEKNGITINLRWHLYFSDEKKSVDLTDLADFLNEKLKPQGVKDEQRQ